MKTKNSKINNVILNTIKIIEKIEVILAVLILLIMVAPIPFHIKPHVIMSGSMEPNLHVGAIAYVNENFNTSSLKKGDIIAFQETENILVSHRIKKIDDVQKQVITKGDANKTEDFNPVSYNQIRGTVDFSIPFVGYVIVWLSKTANQVLLIGIIIIQNLIQNLFSRLFQE